MAECIRARGRHLRYVAFAPALRHPAHNLLLARSLTVIFRIALFFRSCCPQAQLEFFKARLIDTIEEKQKKAAQQSLGRGRGTDAKTADGKAGAGDKRKRTEPERISVLPASYTLTAEELKADMEEISTNVDHYSVRSAAAASDDLRSSAAQDAWFDRSRQLLHANGHSLERGSTVFVYLQGQRVDDTWTLTAMNAVEVTLRDADGTKLKVTLAQVSEPG